MLEVYTVKFTEDLEFTEYPLLIEASKDSLNLIKTQLTSLIEREKSFAYDKSLNSDCNYTVKLYQSRINDLYKYQTLIWNCKSINDINCLSCVSILLHEVIQPVERESYDK